MKKSNWFWIILFFLIVATGGYYYAKNNQKFSSPVNSMVLKLGYTTVPAHAMFIAKERGYFNEAGLNVDFQKFSNANLIMEALSRGDLDGAGAVSYSTLFAFENISPGKFKIYHGFTEIKDNGWSSLVVKKNKGIKEAKDLIGKKIVMRTGLSSKVQAELVLKAIGLNLNDIELVPVESSLLVAVFAKDEISAFLDVQPFAAIIVQKGLGDVLIKSPRAEFIQNPYPQAAAVLSQSFIDKNPDIAKKFVSAINKAIDFINSNDTETRKIFKQYLELDEDIAMNMPLAKFEKVSEIDREAVGRLSDFEVGYKILDKKPVLTSVYWNK